MATKNIIEKLETLPAGMVNKVEDFIDFLRAKHSKKPSDINIQENLAEEPKSLYGAAKDIILM